MNETPQDKLKATLVKALREVARLRKRTAELEGASAEPIAVVGVGLRLPGGVTDLSSLWAMLSAEVDSVAPIPLERWDVEPYFDPNPDTITKTYVREAALLERVDQFDPAFFNITPHEAEALDPQHRLLLEAAWESLERAGIAPRTLVDSSTGVFVGIGPSDYERWQDLVESDVYDLLGSLTSFAAGRLSFTLGLQGPSMPITTACSSSLVALHLARASLLAGECDLALAAGVQVLVHPDAFVALARTRALAPDGRSKTFSALADGYGRGEGVIVLALQRWSDAQAAGRPVLALLRGSAVNHDGPSNGITAPNGTSQRKLLQATLNSAGLEPADVDFVECHGTGTSLGDPIEVQALAAVYGRDRPADRPLLIGAIKPNVGHLESASGLAGVAKVLAAMQHGQLPATLHTQPRNPHIDWDDLPVEVVDKQRTWTPPAGQPRRAAVSAFGLSGTNAHVILEEAPRVERAGERPSPPALPFVLSARSDAALLDQAARLRAYLQGKPELALVDVAHSLVATREQFERRAYVVASSRQQLDAGLERVDAGLAFTAKRGPQLAVLFTGQGSQRLGMGRELAQAYPEFGTTLEQIFTEFDPYLDVSLRELMLTATGEQSAELLDQTAYTQPALFALELALFRLLASWGLAPDILLGHSIGEVVAAHVAGVFSLADACKLVAARGRLMQALPSGGAMLSIQASEQDVVAVLERYPGVDIAGLNGPLSTVVSGDERPILALSEHFAGQGCKTRRLTVSHAFHSSRMEPMLAEFRAVVQSLSLQAPTLAVVSNVTGGIATKEQLTDPDYWVRHVRQAVRFLDGVRTLESQRVGVMVELGPQAVLAAMASSCLHDNEQINVVTSLRRDESEAEGLARCLGSLHACGVKLDWAAVLRRYQPRQVDLPTYAFQRQRYWLEVSKRRTRTTRSLGLLGERIASPLAVAQFRAILDPSQLPLHVKGASTHLHPAVMLSMALLAADQVSGGSGPTEVAAQLESSLTLVSERETTVQLLVHPLKAGIAEYELHAQDAERSDTWQLLARGSLSSQEPSSPRPTSVHTTEAIATIGPMPFACTPTSPAAFVAQLLTESGAFDLELKPRPSDLGDYPLHPAHLDAAVQLGLWLSSGRGATPIAYEIISWARAQVFAELPAKLRLHLWQEDAASQADEVVFDVLFESLEGHALARIDGLRARNLGPIDLTLLGDSSQTIESRLCELAKSTLAVAPELDTDLARDTHADSLSIIAFMAAVQREFSVGLQLLFSSQSFSVRSLAAAIRGDEVAPKSREFDYAQPPSPGRVDVRQVAAEQLPGGYALEPASTTWMCSLADSFEIEVAEFGEGAPLVLLAPFNSEWPIWTPVIKRMMADHRVLAVNYPGSGRSRRSGDLDDMSQLVAWLCWVFDALELTGVTLVGWSFGGFVAQKLSVVRPDLVSRMVLVNTTAKLGSAETAVDSANMVTTLNTHFEQLLAAAPPDQREVIRSMVYHGQDQRSFDIAYHKMLTTWDFRDELAQIRQPTIVVSAINDPLVPPEASGQIADLAMSAEHRILDHSGHYVPTFAPETLCSYLREARAATLPRAPG
ncbi:type I polyketide synthase [Enhygromyxa salina]|uniref:Phenolphthiocerol synthesis polyketide synthase type I Pks15/1 n=1 Tax=Enhygromyxa salina TaxID=215803 RepID=A0A2S9YVI5_9BACT|nr:type I polyketide synthase [Enhygromyxa salina]PRQ09059.1 Phenolphthiocerol synthesis polyketide synthase type I Pks15/1 [Enhygromyxa salina]